MKGDVNKPQTHQMQATSLQIPRAQDVAAKVNL